MTREATQKKLEQLRANLREKGKLVICFSGGVDSSVLAAVAAQELGDGALAVMVHGDVYPEAEQAGALKLAESIGIRLETTTLDHLAFDVFADNPPDRCYHCKLQIVRVIGEIAQRHGIDCIADGTQVDDAGDYRPGQRALKEGGVWSPLRAVGLGKREIRELSRTLGLETADMPSLACLASRFPYGDRITSEGLRAVDALETALRAEGFTQCRVRHHGTVARIEVEPTDIPRLCEPVLRERILAAGQLAGYTYVALDLQGYRQGSLNETLED